MDGPSTPSLAGPARRSRRLQGPAELTSSVNGRHTPTNDQGHRGNATGATGSPYSGRPQKQVPASESHIQRRKSVGEGLLRRARQSIGWLIQRAGGGLQNGSGAEEGDSSADANLGKSRIIQDDLEAGSSSAVSGGFRAPSASRLGNGLKTRPNSIAAMPGASTWTNNAHHPQGGFADPPASILSSRLRDTAESSSGSALNGELSPSKRLRTSHSTLTLPTASTLQPSHSRASTGAADVSPYGRHRSPVRSSFTKRPTPLPLDATYRPSIFRPASIAGDSRTNGFASGQSSPVSPQRTPVLPLSADDTTLPVNLPEFGLRSQSPFRINRSPEVSLAPLSLSRGMARSPSFEPSRLPQSQTAGRLYPYGRESPVLHSPMARTGLGLPSSKSYAGGLTSYAGQKRGNSLMSASPPKISPLNSNFRWRPAPASNFSVSPHRSEFGEFAHRDKRQRTNLVWHPEKGFVAGDDSGKPLPDADDQPEAPKNDAERILQRLESTRNLQIDGMRNRSPTRFSIPVPSSSRPDPGSASIFATRINSIGKSASEAAISPMARRQRAAEEANATSRNDARSGPSLDERMREDLDNRNRSRSPQRPTAAPKGRRAGREMPTSERESEAEMEDEVVDLPSPKRKASRRARTRSQSVLSEVASASETEEPPTSPQRRSTRRRGENASQSDAVETERRGRSDTKSVKRTRSPRKAAVSEKKAQKPASDLDEDSDPDSAVRTRSGRRIRSPSVQPASPPPTLRKSQARAARAASPQHSVSKPAASSIQQVLQDSASTPRAGFSAKDATDDIPPEPISPSRAQPTLEKLKLPSSVFASRTRFKFASSPSSPKLVPTQTSSNGLSLSRPTTANRIEAPTFSFDSGNAAASSSGSIFAPAPAVPLGGNAPPSFSFSAPKTVDTTSAPPAAAAASTTDPAAPSATAIKAPQPLFSFTAPSASGSINASQGTSSASAASATAAPTAPLGNTAKAAPPSFSFTKPAHSAPQPAPDSAAQAQPKSLFSFTPAPASAASTRSSAQTSSTADAAKATTPTFNFGPSAATSANIAAKPFSFTSNTAAPAGTSAATSAGAATPAFTFGASNGTSAANVSTPNTTSAASAAPVFSFGTTAPDTAKNSEATKSAFSFGQPTTSQPAAAVPATSFSFKPAASSVDTSAAKPAFVFGAAPAAPTVSNPFAAAATASAAVTPGTAVSSNPFAAAAAPAASVFSGFNFSKPASAAASANGSVSPTAPGSSGGPTFNFGGPATPSGTTTPSFVFGQPSAQPAFTFGAGTPQLPSASGAMQPSGSANGGMFSIGAGGDEPTSPSKRNIRPLRTAKRR